MGKLKGMERMELGERKQKILTAVIDAYIRSRRTGRLQALVEMLDNAVSSATIRNEMAELSAMGYLEQPHTSAGRVPTARAFRLYIDRLMRRQSFRKPTGRTSTACFPARRGIRSG